LNRGDVCWYTFKTPNKRRPVLILALQGGHELMLSLAYRDSRIIPERNDRLLLEPSVQ
jgi:hypothetical protein